MKNGIVFDFRSIAASVARREPTPVCTGCEDGGWEMYSTGHMDPHYRVCSLCHNPKGLPCP